MNGLSGRTSPRRRSVSASAKDGGASSASLGGDADQSVWPRVDGRYYDDLWQLCRKRGTAVVADVHVHPAGAYQSGSDRENPMISRSGHVALIIPNFAAPPVRRPRVGIYEYQGGKAWRAIAPGERATFFHIGL